MDGKHLCDLNEKVSELGNTLNTISKPTVGFLKEYNECIKKDFISWIKKIIKGKLPGRLFSNHHHHHHQ